MKIEKERVQNYLKKINGPACTLCGNNHWEISNTVFQALEFDFKGLQISGAAYPIVPLTCANCGNTYFINALVAKLIDPPRKENTTNSDDENEENRGGEIHV